jgi:hypothetical protein
MDIFRAAPSNSSATAERTAWHKASFYKMLKKKIELKCLITKDNF